MRQEEEQGERVPAVAAAWSGVALGLDVQNDWTFLAVVGSSEILVDWIRILNCL